MGCCVSTKRASVATKKVKKRNVPKSKHARKNGVGGGGGGGGPSKSPPPTLPLSDEETVKEVLSETPSVPKKQNQSPFIKSAPLLPDFSKPPEEKHPNSDNDATGICKTNDESSDVSAKASENNDVREVTRRSPARFKNRPPPAAETKRDKTLGKSRSAPSVDRSKGGSVPSSGYGRRRTDVGEISGRRSSSPVSRVDCGSSKTDLGRSPSSRRTGKSPGRVGSGLGDKLRKVDEGGGRDKRPPTSNESFENPVVSLECFIFL